MKEINRYFPDLSRTQLEQMSALSELYKVWNEKINVISRKDIQHLYLKHVLHSLAISKWIQFKKEAEILDLGTGGGFPGIPLAILFPECQFTLLDATAKKIGVVKAISHSIGLENIQAIHQRIEVHQGNYDFVVSRAVTNLFNLCRWSKKLIGKSHRHFVRNGLIALKGGNLESELKNLPQKQKVKLIPIDRYYDNEFFREKFIVYVPLD